ncbi:hypothetical protein PCE1_001436 [Barthelona sp. PCE]
MSHIKVYFYYPNIVGIIRVITCLIAFYFAFNPIVFLSLYLTSFCLDAIDGYLARKFNQCSTLGAVLDMVTDRFGTSMLMVVLAMMYEKFFFLFQVQLALDLASHYSHMYASHIGSEGVKSHKDIDKSKVFVLHLYYTKHIFLGFVCLCNEFFFIILYVLHFWKHPALYILAVLFGIVMAFKQVVNVIQLGSACETLTKFDWEKKQKEAEKKEE